MQSQPIISQHVVHSNKILKEKFKDIPWLTDQSVQLGILTLKDSKAAEERYFVPTGARGLQWLQCYFSGCNTSGILQQNEIKEDKGEITCSFM